jgi:hypothetical protein
VPPGKKLGAGLAIQHSALIEIEASTDRSTLSLWDNTGEEMFFTGNPFEIVV